MFKSKFQIGNGLIYEGYTDGNHWNGWARPWFTREVAEQIAKEVNTDAPNTEMYYVGLIDAFVYKADDVEAPEVFKGKMCGDMLLYPIGNGSWIWDDLAEWCQSADEYLALLKEIFPKADAIYEDTIINLLGREGLMALRESHLIELCGVLEGRRLYAI